MSTSQNALIPTPTLGEFIAEEFLQPLDISEAELAEKMGMQPADLQDILENRRRITQEEAVRLSRAFGMSDQFFVSLDTALVRHREKFGI